MAIRLRPTGANGHGKTQASSVASMTKCPSKLLMSIAIFSAAFMLEMAHAEQVPVTTPDQFIIQLPDIDHEALSEQVRTLRSQLILRKQILEQIVADKKLDGSDVIITAIVPGGLLYAGYRIARYKQAKIKLARVSIDIEEYSGDLLVIQSRLTSVAMVQLH